MASPKTLSQQQSWYPKKSIKATTEIKDLTKVTLQIDVIIVVVNNSEFKAVFELLEPLDEQSKIWTGILGNIGYYLGKYVNYNVALMSIGTAGMSSALPSMIEAIKNWKPRLIVNIGIAYGMKKEQKFGDVLVSMMAANMDMKKVRVSETISTTAIPEIDPRIKSAINLAAQRWEFNDLNGDPIQVHCGLIVSSDTLVNNEDLKKKNYDRFSPRYWWRDGMLFFVYCWTLGINSLDTDKRNK